MAFQEYIVSIFFFISYNNGETFLRYYIRDRRWGGIGGLGRGGKFEEKEDKQGESLTGQNPSRQDSMFRLTAKQPTPSLYHSLWNFGRNASISKPQQMVMQPSMMKNHSQAAFPSSPFRLRNVPYAMRPENAPAKGEEAKKRAVGSETPLAWEKEDGKKHFVHGNGCTYRTLWWAHFWRTIEIKTQIPSERMTLQIQGEVEAR